MAECSSVKILAKPWVSFKCIYCGLPGECKMFRPSERHICTGCHKEMRVNIMGEVSGGLAEQVEYADYNPDPHATTLPPGHEIENTDDKWELRRALVESFIGELTEKQMVWILKGLLSDRALCGAIHESVSTCIRASVTGDEDSDLHKKMCLEQIKLTL